jgi:Holliday junction DNA helicase RuvA
MIALIKGILVQKSADRVIVDVKGVGYEVLIPVSTYYEIGEVGEEVTLQVYTHVREDALSLYGFRALEEKKLFMQLIQVSGIGPKLAITVLSGLPVADLVEAVTAGDIHRLSSIPGVGKKTAERMALELKDKLSKLFPGMEGTGGTAERGIVHQDVVSALVNLGYPRNKAETVVSSVSQESQLDRFDSLLRQSLKELSG